MSFALLGNPKPTFLDSSGDPLASGTLAVLDPADDTNKASYPTYDDAIAKTNANDNPITLNSRGEPPTGLFGLQDEDYKLVLKDSDGSTVWTVDDIFLPRKFTNASVTFSFPTTKVVLKGLTPTPIITTSAYTTGAHSLLRDFTGTSTAAHALQILETLVDDLIENGTLKQ